MLLGSPKLSELRAFEKDIHGFLVLYFFICMKNMLSVASEFEVFFFDAKEFGDKAERLRK